MSQASPFQKTIDINWGRGSELTLNVYVLVNLPVCYFIYSNIAAGIIIEDIGGKYSSDQERWQRILEFKIYHI